VSDADASLDRYLAKLEELGAQPRTIGPVAARAIERETDDQIARGVDPDGKPWPLTKDDSRPLANAAKAVSVRAVNGAVVMTVTGPEALHNEGKARGRIERRIIPSGSLPAPLSRVLSETIDADRARIMGKR